MIRTTRPPTGTVTGGSTHKNKGEARPGTPNSTSFRKEEETKPTQRKEHGSKLPRPKPRNNKRPYRPAKPPYRKRATNPSPTVNTPNTTARTHRAPDNKLPEPQHVQDCNPNTQTHHAQTSCGPSSSFTFQAHNPTERYNTYNANENGAFFTPQARDGDNTPRNEHGKPTLLAPTHTTHKTTATQTETCYDKASPQHTVFILRGHRLGTKLSKSLSPFYNKLTLHTKHMSPPKHKRVPPTGKDLHTTLASPAGTKGKPVTVRSTLFRSAQAEVARKTRIDAQVSSARRRILCTPETAESKRHPQSQPTEIKDQA